MLQSVASSCYCPVSHATICGVFLLLSWMSCYNLWRLPVIVLYLMLQSVAPIICASTQSCSVLIMYSSCYLLERVLMIYSLHSQEQQKKKISTKHLKLNCKTQNDPTHLCRLLVIRTDIVTLIVWTMALGNVSRRENEKNSYILYIWTC